MLAEQQTIVNNKVVSVLEKQARINAEFSKAIVALTERIQMLERQLGTKGLE